MQPSASIARRVAATVAALGAVLLTASCAAGKNAATSEDVPAIDGSIASVGNIDLRGVAILAPPDGSTYYLAGDSAALTMVLVNNGTTPDTLTSVTSSAAGGYQLVTGNTTTLPTPATSSRASGSTSGSASASASESTSTSAGGASVSASAASSSPASVSPSAAVQSVTIAPGSRVSFGLGDSAQSLFLTKLTKALYTASSVTITFTFQNAGSVSFQVPVQITGTPGSSTVPAPSDSAAG